MPDLLFETYCQALASFMKFNTLPLPTNKHVYTVIYSRKLTALLSVEYLGPLGNQSVTSSGIKEYIYSFHAVHLSSFRS